MLKKVVQPAIVLTLICLVMAFALAFTNNVTAKIIEDRVDEDAKAQRKHVFSQANDFTQKKYESEDFEYYEAKDPSGAVIGYVFSTSAKGYGGELWVMTGIDVSGNVTGVVITSNNETPGLGKKAESPDFTGQYLKHAPEGGFAAVKKSTGGDNEIDVITGATVTSNAVTAAVNKAVRLFYSISGGAR